jgi:hypothetical protein
MPSPKGFKMLAANQDTLPPAWHDERAFAIPSPEIIFAVNAAKRRRAEEARQEIPVWDDDGGAQLGMNRAHPGRPFDPELIL